MDSHDELYTPEQAAQVLKLHLDSVRRLLRQGKLPGVKVGGSWRIARSALQEMLDGRRPFASKGPSDMK